MKKSNNRYHGTKASILALVVASVGCGVSSEPGAEGIDSAGLGAMTQENCISCPEGIESTIIEIAPNEYYVSYRVALDASQGTVWSNIKNFETLVDIAFAGAVTDFEWIEGSPGVAPALVEFNFGDQPIVEAVTYINNFTKKLGYVVAETPVLGIEEYSALVDVDACGFWHSSIEFTREVRFSPGTDANSFFDLFMSEMINIQTYFGDPNI